MGDVKRKRWRVPTAKPGVLRVSWGIPEAGEPADIVYTNGEGVGRADSRLMAFAFETIRVHDGKSLREELQARGYDLTTLKFEIFKQSVPTP